MKKKIIAIVFIVAIFTGGFFFASPRQAKAQLPFGGFVTWTMPCTCSANFWMMMVPLFMPSPGAGALVYQPGATITYLHNAVPVPGVWLLGDYIPGVQACYIVIPFGCMVIPSMGVIKQTGTSLPI